MGNKTAYKTRHARTEDENAFYSELSEAMINARIEENVTQQVMGKICGYSEQQIRKYEQIGTHPYSTDKVYPIPAYIMMQYARRLHKSAEELCSNWFDNNEKTASPMYRNNLDKMRSRLKKITDTERDLIMNLRKIKRVGVTRITKFLTYCDMGDYELMYCMKQIEYSDDEIAETIRKHIYDLYIRLSNDNESAKRTISEDLRSPRVLYYDDDDQNDLILDDIITE